MDDVAPESRYWNQRIAQKPHHTGVGHISYSERTNRRRKRAVMPVLDEIYQIHLPDGLAGKKVFDAGCGTGIYSDYYVQKGAEVTGADAAASAVAKAQAAVPDATFVHAGLTTVPLPTDSQDVVHCFSVLFHIMEDADWAKAIAELLRVVRPEGLIVVRTEKVAADVDVAKHQRLRAWDRYQAAFAAGGFHPVLERSVKDMPRWTFAGRRFGPLKDHPDQRVTVFKQG